MLLKPTFFHSFFAVMLFCWSCQTQQTEAQKQSDSGETTEAAVIADSDQKETVKEPGNSPEEAEIEKRESQVTEKSEEVAQTRSVSAFQGYNCNGNEPFWNIKVEPGTITFRELGETPVVYPYQAPKQSGNVIQFETAAEVEGKKSVLKFSLEDETCADNMSGKKFPYTVQAEKDGKQFQGCGEKL